MNSAAEIREEIRNVCVSYDRAWTMWATSDGEDAVICIKAMNFFAGQIFGLVGELLKANAREEQEGKRT